MNELRDRFDALVAQMAPAQHKCNETYIAWTRACHEWNLLCCERDKVWGELIERSIASADHLTKKDVQP